MKAVVLAGGSGERFWPLSTLETPKQFLNMFGEQTLIEQTCQRLFMRLPPEDVLIITSKEHVKRTKDLLPDIPKKNIIGEPERKNTGPACALGALLSDPDEVNLIVPADHRISDPSLFWDAFDKGLAALKERNGLYTFGIHPKRPETGYGYIEAGENFAADVYSVRSFREKPDRGTAERFVADGDFYWNSGMFIWEASTFLEELKVCSPDIFVPMAGIDPRVRPQLEKAYRSLPVRSVDYAVMERSSKVMMIDGRFDWSDVGNWSSIIDLEGYTPSSDTSILIDSDRVFIRSTLKRPVGIVGLDGIVVIDTENGLLICSEEQIQKVREISRSLRKT